MAKKTRLSKHTTNKHIYLGKIHTGLKIWLFEYERGNLMWNNVMCKIMTFEGMLQMLENENMNNNNNNENNAQIIVDSDIDGSKNNNSNDTTETMSTNDDNNNSVMLDLDTHTHSVTYEELQHMNIFQRFKHNFYMKAVPYLQKGLAIFFAILSVLGVSLCVSVSVCVCVCLMFLVVFFFAKKKKKN